MTPTPAGTGARPRRRGTVPAAGWLAAAFAARLAFGLTSEFWGDDELQIYLIGLRAYTTGEWPLFGPDVVYTHTQVPGALQGLLIGLPFLVAAEPEAPYVLLNVLSFGALVLLGWYITRRIPDVPRWFLWPWVLFSPWTLYVSAHVTNPSYVLAGAVLFFVGAAELTPALGCGAVPRRAAAMAMGFGALWVAQLHLSAALLGPIALAVFVLLARESSAAAARALAWSAAGATVAGFTLLPTLLAAGPAAVAGSAGANVVFEPGHLVRVPQVAAQYFSFAAFEVPRFLGAGTAERLALMDRYAWAAPFIVVAGVLGVAQAATLVAALVTRGGGRPDWPAVRTATAALVTLVAASFALSVRAPASHAFYLVLPAASIYAFHVWTPLFRRRAVRALAVVLLAAGSVTHVAVAARNFRDRSLYVNRPLVVRAIEEREYRLLGERRPELWRAR